MEGDGCGAALLDRIRTPTDALEVDAAGELTIAGHEARRLLQEFGSPLYVTVEETLRRNYRAALAAFQSRWPAGVEIFYAIKTNNVLAVRAILHQEGAGGECFGPMELRATFAGGADPNRILINGSDKQEADILEATGLGATLIIDGEDEIEILDRPGLREGPTPVLLRLKPQSDAFDQFSSAFFKTESSVKEAVRQSKWGYSVEAARGLVERIQRSPHIRLLGYSSHVGRFSNLASSYAVVAQTMAQDCATLRRETGFWPEVLDLGGGWARRREPESRSPDMNPHSIEDYAAAVTDALRASLPPDAPPPRLWLEPGRYIVGNAVTLLATVGAVKRDLGRVWVHVDASTNLLMRIETSRSWHQILPASRMNEPWAERANIVGPTCIPSLLGENRDGPALRRGDVVAILDAGMYAEVISNQFNGTPRPANVLIGPNGPEVIRERERFEDIFGRHRIPERLQAKGD